MIFILCLFLLILLIFILSYFAPKFNLVDLPDERKLHTGSVPLVGGIAIYTSFITYLFLAFGLQEKYLFIYLSSIIFIIAILDDIYNINVTIRLILQLFVTLVVIGTGLIIVDIGDYYFFPPIKLYIFSIFLTVLSVLGLTNAINFIDGIDGLCSGILLNAFISLMIFSYFYSNIAEISLILFLSLSILIFIFFNFQVFNLKKIFLGDAGSVTLGFILSWFLIYYSHPSQRFIHPILTIWCVTLPVYDLLSVIIRRVMNKINPFRPDRTHLHHLMLKSGLSNKKVFVILILFSLIINSLGGLTFYFFGPSPSLLFFIILFFIYFFTTLKLSIKVK
tara:strand:- start:113 stop:1117 length:1005 start_codon:yes stop_codon:yes gene_type:complete